MSKKKRKDDLDTETTIANMNVEGFRWYDPKRNGKRKSIGKVTRKEYWAMVRGAFAAMLPMFACILIGGICVVLLAYLWLR
ncbi:MAG: hypothetical protein IJF64_01745 [Clostridia bacterium]|nr:hypothetical protein [Clostridia bacterium]